MSDEGKPISDVTEKVAELQVDEKSSDSAPKTVFASAEDFNVVHPLTHKWTLWYTKPQTGNEEWRDLLKNIVTVSTVEEFWGAYNTIPKVSELPVKADYSFFKEGITPEWENEANAKGGRWSFQGRAGRRPHTNISVDEAWLKVLLGMIGGTLDNENPELEEINGAFVNIRKAGTRISLWTKTQNKDNLRAIGLRFKEILGLGPRDEVEFMSHDSKDPKNKYTV